MRLFFRKQDFWPDKLDIRYPILERFEHTNIICLSFSQNCLKYALYQIHRGKFIQNSETCYYSYGLLLNEEKLLAALENLRLKYNTSYCVCLISGGFEVILLNKSLKTKNLNAVQEYQALLGNMYESSKRYIHLENPNFEKTLIFSFDRYYIQKLTDTLTQEGFILAKLECSTYNLIKAYLNSHYYFEAQLNALVVLDLESLVVLKLDSRNWQAVTFRNRKDVSLSSNVITALLDRLEIQGLIGYYSNLEQDVKLLFKEAYTRGESINLNENIADPDFHNILIH